ncbi:MAG: alpha/beta fold hydrolase [Candidatus Dormibacteraceae bacterium]
MSNYFESQGLKIAFYQAGALEAPPVILVHGFASDYHLNWVGSGWERTLVTAGFRVVGLDCRGHGSSDKPHDPTSYAISTMTDDVLQLLDHLNITQAHWLGYSMGSRITLEAALKHPKRVNKVGLAGVGKRLLTDNSARAQLIARRLRGDVSVTDPQAQLFFDFATARPPNDLQALSAAMLGHQAPLSAHELARMNQPTLVIAGDRDEMAIGSVELATLIPKAVHINITGRNHMNAVPSRLFKEPTVKFFGA